MPTIVMFGSGDDDDDVNRLLLHRENSALSYGEDESSASKIVAW